MTSVRNDFDFKGTVNKGMILSTNLEISDKIKAHRRIQAKTEMQIAYLLSSIVLAPQLLPSPFSRLSPCSFNALLSRRLTRL